MAQLENFRLKVFRAVAENLNFRKAAEDLFITQPAVTLQIKALEQDLGVRLFDRTANRVTLTAQGLVLLRAAKKVSAIVSNVEQELDAEVLAILAPLRQIPGRAVSWVAPYSTVSARLKLTPSLN